MSEDTKDTLGGCIGCVGIILGLFVLYCVGFGLWFFAPAFFVALDKLFYLNFDAPVIVVWAFWGFVVGAAIQGCREMKIYGRKGIGILIVISPVLLLVLVSAVKIKRDPLNHIKANTARLLSEYSGTESMVLIPAGESETRRYHPDGSLKAADYVGAFYIDKYEVTNAKYVVFLNASGKHEDKGYRWFNPKDPEARIEHIDGVYRVKAGYENHPASRVSWYGAMAYAKWAQKRLPTYAEWNRAARGGLVGKNYRWGDRFNVTGSNIADEVGGTTPVGSYAPNGYGLYDMWGNVSEWCLDGDNDIVAKSLLDHHLFFNDKISNVINDFTSGDTYRALAGGNWRSPTRLGYRMVSHPPSVSGGSVGFRCVTTVPPAERD